MSKNSPIVISDSEESDDEDKEERETEVLLVSGDENVNSNDKYTAAKSLTIKEEPALSPGCKDSTSIPKLPIVLNKKRLQLLSNKIKRNKEALKVDKVREECVKEAIDFKSNQLENQASNCQGKNDKEISYTNVSKHSYPVKIESSSPRLFESNKIFSPVKSDNNETNSPSKTSGTPKRKINLEKSINSPRKVGAFGSPEKPLKQATLDKDSFSPKKLMTKPEVVMDDNSFHFPPLHATQVSGYGTALHCNKLVMNFMDSQVDFLDAIKEEDLFESYIDHLLGLMTFSRKPSPELCFSVMKELLLMCHSHSLSNKTYNALKRIQAIHPVVPEQMVRKLSFDFLKEIVERLEMEGCTCKHQVPGGNCLKSSNALKTLTFLVDIMEVEVQRKQFSPRKTIAFRLVSLQRNPDNMVSILSWMSKAIELCCQSSSQSSQNLTVLDLIQRLIQLSISTTENPEHYARLLANELITTYSQLPNLECRTLLLQTLSSHLVRGKFLSSFVNVFCEKLEKNDCVQEFSGIKQIVENDFLCLPIKRDTILGESASRGCEGFHRSERECEEHAMVIAYSLQSYLFCHHKKLQRTAKKLTSGFDGLQQSQELPKNRHLSMQDESELVNMGDKVQIFAARLFSLCPYFTSRTNQLVEHLSNMKLWDPW